MLAAVLAQLAAAAGGRRGGCDGRTRDRGGAGANDGERKERDRGGAGAKKGEEGRRKTRSS